MSMLQNVEIVRKVGGYSSDGAELFLVAIRSDNAEFLSKQKSVFVDGAKKNGYYEEVAAWIFDMLEQSAKEEYTAERYLREQEISPGWKVPDPIPGRVLSLEEQGWCRDHGRGLGIDLDTCEPQLVHIFDSLRGAVCGTNTIWFSATFHPETNDHPEHGRISCEACLSWLEKAMNGSA